MNIVRIVLYRIVIFVGNIGIFRYRGGVGSKYRNIVCAALYILYTSYWSIANQ